MPSNDPIFVSVLAAYHAPIDLWVMINKLALLAKAVVENQPVEKRVIDEAKTIVDNPHIQEWLLAIEKLKEQKVLK
jgi:hypothetical protein